MANEITLTGTSTAIALVLSATCMPVSAMAATGPGASPLIVTGDGARGSVNPFGGRAGLPGASIDPVYGEIIPLNAGGVRGAVDPFQAPAGGPGNNVDPVYGEIIPLNVDPLRGVVDPFRGSVNPFRGEVNPFYGVFDPLRGAVDPFRGEINPFYGDLDPLRGVVDPFGGWVDPFTVQAELDPLRGVVDPFRGSVDPFRGVVDPFRGTVDPFYSEIDGFWRAVGSVWLSAEQRWANGEDGAAIQGDLQLLLDYTKSTWAPQLTSVGIDYDTLAGEILARNGLDLSNTEALANADPQQRSGFMMDFYDTLMSHSGRNNVDYWMPQVGWSPWLTRTQESGGTPTIGLLDATVENDPDLAGRFGYNGGYDAAVGGHGASVASLMVGAHDGTGVMGIAPNANVVAYNPFDETGTASWDDVTSGVADLVARGASVINMSLGIPGSTLAADWSQVFEDTTVRKGLDNTVFVMAAGNDGAAQTEDAAWDARTMPSFLLVGSVDARGTISRFSNTPGDACLTIRGECANGVALKDRFIVAPGEHILLSDGEGGLTRESGTSFATPIVTGAVALLHSRWPWLADHPEETSGIILSTATDLGEPGTDAVYGRGLLNIRASQSPLDMTRLGIMLKDGGNLEIQPLTVLGAPETTRAWIDDGYLVLFEEVGDTYRDFQVPLGDQFYGNTAYNDQTGTETYLQDYFAGSFEEWWGDGRTTDSDDKKEKKDKEEFTDISSITFLSSDVSVEMRSTPLTRFASHRSSTLAAHSEMRVSGLADGLTIGAGHGVGALSLMGGSGFAHSRDFRADENAVNPVLGFASGGGFMSAAYDLGPALTLSGGISAAHVVHADLGGISQAQRQSFLGLNAYDATAASISLHMRPSRAVTLGLTYSRLEEDEALLGVQSTQANMLDGGAATDGLTMTLDADLGDGFGLAAAATAARTRSNDTDNLIQTGKGLVSSAFQLSMTKAGIVGADRFGFTIKQPMYREAGRLTVSQLGIIDRQTGELGEIRTALDNTQKRPFITEIDYAASLGDVRFSAFGRADVNRGERSGVMGGVSFRIGW
ncbi:S8 family serine peptidase [Pacificimonas sp. WHA3]|uniref:S8 family serine peptidase n=1 Tax=Pacificimonas pallii TaxID=2827236 RepID=A0ABS6SB39_9SPHN|nr:S8 family peptidase [Pacificimonas pallii]MBV7255628.1 S8 family serine peptidase [Pacificimonas pallii]